MVQALINYNLDYSASRELDYVQARKDEQGLWYTDRLTRTLRRETGKRPGVTLHTLSYRYTVVGMDRVGVDEQSSKGYEKEVGEANEAK